MSRKEKIMGSDSISALSRGSKGSKVLDATFWTEADFTRFVVLAGRILYSAIFIIAAFGHFSQQQIGFAAQHGVPMAGLLVPLSGVISLAGGLSILLGYRARIG